MAVDWAPYNLIYTLYSNSTFYGLIKKTYILQYDTIYMVMDNETEYRKIQKTGGSSYIITLPKKWIVDNNLKEGSQLRVSTKEDGSLVVDCKNLETSTNNTYELVIENIDESLLIRRLIAVYLGGYKIIKIKSENVMNNNIKETVEKFCSLVIGIEIIEEERDYIILQDISNQSDLSMMKILGRMYLMASSMVKDVISILNNYDKKLAEGVVKRDLQVDRLNWLISKNFNMVLLNKQHVDNNQVLSFDIKSVARLLERISDHAENIARILIDLELPLYNVKDVKMLEEYLKDADEFLENSYECYLQKNFEKANEIIDRIELFYNKMEKYIFNIEKGKEYNFGAITLVAESIMRIAMYSADMCEITINESVI